MVDDLETILLADEEARARFESFARSAASRLEAEQSRQARRGAERLARVEREREAEISRITAEAQAEVENRRERRLGFLREKKRSADALLSEGAELCARIVMDGVAREEGP